MSILTMEKERHIILIYVEIIGASCNYFSTNIH